ncbi:IPT/TIG domain-containing protein [Tunicatimonas pelagia]|uniref:IPT/TIG domain-containing protein n=1 Tax=Tunicatimonas pelagia TaxID=931531 RepID=UPI002666C0B0|nr:IPT/TIG domain-containing protein [Tunicatimonas pelagia]WKN41514.1 IPT/TIG domain-containing protein [Tunicatimonas pelagia]
MKVAYYLKTLLLVALLPSCNSDEEALPPAITVEIINPGSLIISGNTTNAAMIGDTISIIGQNFSSVPGENRVSVHGIPTSVVTAADTMLQTIVPAGVPWCGVDVRVARDGYQEAIKSIVIRETPSPAITGIAPESGPIGTLVTIYGRNLDETLKDSLNLITFASPTGEPLSVSFLAEPLFVSSDSVQVEVPAGVGTGTISLYAKPCQGNVNAFSIVTPPFTVIP